MKNNFNYFDLITFAVIGGLLILVFFFFTKREEFQTDNLVVTVQVADFTESTVETAKNTNEVYLNSVNKPLKTESVAVKDGTLSISLVGPGRIDDDRYIFNGQRILINQKAEIHSTYFVQGRVSEVKYAKQD